MNVSDEGSPIWVNDEHPLNDEFPIVLTDAGIVIDVNAEQSSKALSSIDFAEEGITIVVKFGNLPKSYFLTDSTDESNVKLINKSHSSNVFCSRFV